MFTRAWPKSVFFSNTFSKNDTIKTKRWIFCVKYKPCVCWRICPSIIWKNEIFRKICIHIRGLKWCKLVKTAEKRVFKGENYYLMCHFSIKVH